MMQKVGPAALKQHFMIMDTICDATQERQDAVYDMVGKQDQVQQDTATASRTLPAAIRPACSCLHTWCD